MISVLYSVSRVGTGLGKYADRLFKGFEDLKIEVQKFGVTKREYSIAGKPILGNLSQVLGTRIRRPSGDVVHSLSPEVIHPKTNVVTVHDIIPLKMKEVFSDTYYRSKGNEMVFGRLKNIDHLISFTEVGKKELMELAEIPGEKIDVVTQSVDDQVFFREPDKQLRPPNKKLIVAVGDLNPRKRFDLLFEALRGVEGYEVVHIGPTNAWESRKKELEDLIEGYGNIKMLGGVDETTLRRYVSSADLLVHLSMAEGFGSTPIEAITCGTNVLVNDLDIFRETLEDKAFFTSLEPDDILKNVEYALSHGRSPEDLIQYSRRYSMTNMAKNTIRVYGKINSEYLTLIS